MTPDRQAYESHDLFVWVLFNPGTVGSSASGTLEVSVTETGGTFSVPIEANVIAKPTVASSMVLDRSGGMGAPSGVAGLKRIEVLRNSAPLFVHLLGDDAVASVLDCFRDFDQELPPDVVLGYIRLAKATVAAEMRLVRSLPPGVIPPDVQVAVFQERLFTALRSLAREDWSAGRRRSGTSDRWTTRHGRAQADR